MPAPDVFPDTAGHPLPALLAAGVGCSLGADDPLMFGAGLLEEYETARARQLHRWLSR